MADLSNEIEDIRGRMAHFDALEQIRTRIYSCARALDRLDRELLIEQFWPEAQIDYGSIYRGTIQGFVDAAMTFQGSMRDTQHFIGNSIIEVQGEIACAESYVHAHHVIAGPEGLIQLLVGGRYLDRFARRDSIWRLSYRTEILDWGRRLPVSEQWFELNTELPKGLRGQEDLSYQFLRGSGL